MKVIQLSDLHLRGDGQLSFRVADTPAMMEDCVRHITSLPWKPDAIVITGDLADSGAVDAYELLRQFADRLPGPVFLLPGNHDKRDRMLQYLKPYCPVDVAISPYICFTYDALPMRLIGVDGTHPGSHSGHLDEPVALWLENKLQEQPEVPTLLFTHHPPFLTGFVLMDEPYENTDSFTAILKKYPNVRLCCGHIHRAFTTTFADRIAVTCPSVAMQIEVDLTSGGGDEFRMEAPGYLIHHWFEGQCNSHVCQIPCKPTYSGPHKFVGSINPV